MRTARNFEREDVRADTGIDCQVDKVTGEPTPSMTQQHHKEECDMNVIVKRFGLTGALPTNVRMPTHGDFLDVPDYLTAMNAIREADESFMMMPADVRARFQNDPHQFVEFCSKEENRDEAIRLGLVEKPKVQPSAEPASVPAPAAPAPVVEAPKTS